MVLDMPRYPDLRVSTITPANMQLLQQAGAWQELQQAAPTFQHMQVIAAGDNWHLVRSAATLLVIACNTATNQPQIAAMQVCPGALVSAFVKVFLLPDEHLRRCDGPAGQPASQLHASVL